MLRLIVMAAALWLSLPAAADTLADIRARGTVRVGVSETSPPFSWRDPVRGLVGYDIDLAAAVADKLGARIDKVTILNKQRLSALTEGTVDLVATGMTRTARRAEQIDFSVAYFNSPHKVLIRRDSGITAIGDLAGRTLGLVASASVDGDLLRAVPTLKLVYFDHYQAAFDALAGATPAAAGALGRMTPSLDSFLADELLLLSFAQRSGRPDEFALLPGYELPRTAGFGIRKGEPRWAAFVDATLLELEATGRAAAIFDAWFAPLPRPFRIVPDQPAPN